MLLSVSIDDLTHVGWTSLPWRNKTPPPPEPVTVDSEEEYEVNYIRDSKLFGRTLKYLVRWTGYGEGEDTWEPAKNLAHALDKIKDFHALNHGAPRKIAALIYASLPWQLPMVVTQANVDVDP